MPYLSTKKYGHEVGLSCAFRQWRANSHCRFIHGYAISVRLEFEADELDDRNWVIDFGGLKEVKGFLENLFDHRLLIAADDPEKEALLALDEKGLARVSVLPNVGCEAFAESIWGWVDAWLLVRNHSPRVRLVSAEVAEHGANSAIYTGP